MQVHKTLLSKPATGAPEPPATLALTYADGSQQELEISEIKIDDILEEIDMSNGRIAALELERGRPF